MAKIMKIFFFYILFFPHSGRCNNQNILSEPPKIDERKLLHLLKHDCGSCHGMSLKGGLGLPLNQLENRSWKEIKAIIQFGRTGTAMPPWTSILSETEIEWIARFLTDKSKVSTLFEPTHPRSKDSNEK